MILYFGVFFVFFFNCTSQHVGSQFPDQGSNPCPLQWKHAILTAGRPKQSLTTCLYILMNKCIEWQVDTQEREERMVRAMLLNGQKEQGQCVRGGVGNEERQMQAGKTWQETRLSFGFCILFTKEMKLLVNVLIHNDSDG